MPILLGIDTGGTYTDAVLHDEASGQVLAAAKALTTRHDLAVGIRGAAASVLEVSGIAPASVALVSLSTTLATNALVEGQGGRVGLVLIGFDEAAASRAGIVDALRGAPASGSTAVSTPQAVHAGQKTRSSRCIQLMGAERDAWGIWRIDGQG